MDVERILRDIGFDPVLRKGNNLWVRCPNPEHEDIHPSCSISSKDGLWKCWSCDTDKGMKGNLTFLIRVKTGCSWKRAKAIAGGEASVFDTLKNLKGKLVYDETTAKNRFEDSRAPTVLMPNEAETLKSNNEDHKPYLDYLAERGFDMSVVRFFRLRCCRTGLYGGRVLAPIMLNKLPRGFSARLIYEDEVPIGHDDAKYLFSRGMEVTKVIYNYDHITQNQPLIVVEGVTDVWHLWKMGHKRTSNVCAILTSRISSHQLDLLASKRPSIIYWMMDGDVNPDNSEGKFEANKKMIESAFDDVRYVILGKTKEAGRVVGMDPTDYLVNGIVRLLNNAGDADSSPLQSLKNRLRG